MSNEYQAIFSSLLTSLSLICEHMLTVEGAIACIVNGEIISKYLTFR